MNSTILASLWRKIHGIGITNPSETTSLLRDLDHRLNRMEAALEEMATNRPSASEDARGELPVEPKGDDGGRSGSKPTSKGSAPRRGK